MSGLMAGAISGVLGSQNVVDTKEQQQQWLAADDANVLKRAAEIRGDPERMRRVREVIRQQRDDLAALLDIIG